jgi:AcrR family transcriptional regulator
MSKATGDHHHPDAPNRRERKKLATRRALASAALRLVAQRGLDGVTVEQMADAANVSPRTFFNYFPTKEDALAGHGPDEAERARAALVARPPGEEPLAALRAVLCELSRELEAEGEQWRLRRELMRSEPRLLAASLAAWARLERALAEAIAQRTGADADRDLYPALVVACAVAATRVATLRWQAGAGTSLGELVAEAIDELAGGLKPPSAADMHRRSLRRAR